MEQIQFSLILNMKGLSLFLLFSGCFMVSFALNSDEAQLHFYTIKKQHANGQDIGTVNLNFITSLLNEATAQSQRAQSYIDQYTAVNSQLSQASNIWLTTFQDTLNMTNVRGFLSDINEHLNNNVLQLTVQYSPVNIQSYILSFLPTVLSNLATDSGAETQLLAMNSLYYSKILSPNASECMSTYDANHLQIYSGTATNFTKLLETKTSTTGAQLDTMKGEINTMVTNLVGSVETIITNPLSARQLFDDFVRKTSNKY